MKRYNNNTGKAAWGLNRPDSYPVNRFGGRPPIGSRREGVGFNRSSGDDGDIEGRLTDDRHPDDHVSNKLDQVLEKLEKFDVWREDADRRFELLGPSSTRDLDMPSGFDDGDDPPWDANRGGRSMDKGFPNRNPNSCFRDGQPEERGRRERRNRTGPGWDLHGDKPQYLNRPASCWDHRDVGGARRNHMSDGDGETRQPEESRREETGPPTLDRVLERLERLEKLGTGRDDDDRRFENRDHSWSREQEPPTGYDDSDEWEYEEARRHRSGERTWRGRNPNGGFREPQQESRPRREGGGRNGPGWTTHGLSSQWHPYGGFDQPFDRPATCWDPPQKYQGSAMGFARRPGGKMDPPRFNGTDAANWISRVQYYFNHLMIPEAQRIHYAVMLFDQPAAEWVFNYGANNEFVTWHEFLGDVRHRFDRVDHRQRQGFEEYPRRHQHLHNGRAEQPTYRSLQSDRILSHGTTPLTVVAPPRSGFTHRPQQSSNFIDSGKQCGLPNTPNLMVRSLIPVQQAALDDYNEKLGIYRLEQAALLASLNGSFEENIQDENLAEEKTDNTPTIVFGDEVPNDITDAHNDGAPPDVPNNESPGEFIENKGIVKNDNEPPQVLVGVYDEKIGEEEDTASMKKGKPMYLKDVVSKKLIEAGPELSDEEDGSGDDGENNKLKSYSQEQEELRKQIVKSLEEEDDGSSSESEGNDEESIKIPKVDGDNSTDESDSFDKDGSKSEVNFEEKAKITKNVLQNIISSYSGNVDGGDDSGLSRGNIDKSMPGESKSSGALDTQVATTTSVSEEKPNITSPQGEEELQRTIFISNLPFDITVEEVKQRFSAFGEEYYGAEDVDPQFGTDEDEKLHIDNVLWNASNMLSDDDKELPHGGFMKCLLATKTFNIGLNMPAKPAVFPNVQDFDGDYYVGRRLPIRRVFDPGGDASPKLLLPTIVVAS